MMDDSSPTLQARSFIMLIHDGTFQERVSCRLPAEIVAPFANRLFQTALKEIMREVQEPWYVIVPLSDSQTPVQRALLPEGITSLYGKRYFPEQEPPPRLRLHPQASVTHFTLQLLEFEKVVYSGDYSVDDFFLAFAEFLTRQLIAKGVLRMEEEPFYYTVNIKQEEVRTIDRNLFPSDAYQVEGVFPLPVLAEDRERTIFHKVPSTPLNERSPEAYGTTHTYGMGKRGAGWVMMDSNVYQTLCNEIVLSSTVEDGGYLLGTPYRLPGSPVDEEDHGFTWLVEITDVIKAETAWGQPGLLLFTGETWSQVHRRRDRDFPDKKMVSWFHTHLFKASENFGLSELDQNLHRRFLTKPWQVAILLNIDLTGERTIRCFQRGSDGRLVECTFEVFDKPIEADTK